jgi:pimeloyl-ACP methyl ester carboxylesterase
VTVAAAGDRAPAGIVLALHSSASSGAQWRGLAAQLGACARVATPDLWGYGAAPMWTQDTPLALAHEAGRAIGALPHGYRGQVDLVGHSYGGAVALHVARHYRHLVRSLVLIEPVAFHLLASAPASTNAGAAREEVESLVACIRESLAVRAHARGMARFVDYWNGAGAWAALRPEQQSALAARLPKVALDFDAAFAEPGDLGSLSAVRCPVLVLRGADSPRPVRLVATLLAGALPRAELATLADAGHMLPVTHAAQCNELIAWHFGWRGANRPGRAA